MRVHNLPWKLATFNLITFFSLCIECQLLSLLAVASLSGLLKPKPHYPPPHFVPPPYYDHMATSGSRSHYQIMPPPSSYSSYSRPSSSGGYSSLYGSPRNLISSPLSSWRNSIVSHPESRKVPSFYGSYPENGYRFMHGPPSNQASQYSRQGIQPVFYPNGVGDHYKSLPARGRSFFKL